MKVDGNVADLVIGNFNLCQSVSPFFQVEFQEEEEDRVGRILAWFV